MDYIEIRKPFDIKHGIITNIKPIEIKIVIKNNSKIPYNNKIVTTYSAIYTYANNEKEADQIKEVMTDFLTSRNEIISALHVTPLKTIIIDQNAKAIASGAGKNKGIERVIICSNIPYIDTNAFDQDTIIVRNKTKKR